MTVNRSSKKIRSLTEWCAWECADLVITDSKRSAIALETIKKGVAYLPNFIDLKNFKPLISKRVEIRAKHNITANEKIVGLIGPFNIVYNRDLLIFLRQNIHRFDKKIKFFVIGNLDEYEKIPDERIIYTGYVEDYLAHLSALN